MSSDKADYSGMTTNERLYAAGLIGQFDAAAKSKNQEEMLRILMLVEIPEDDAAWITSQILANPRRYGY